MSRVIVESAAPSPIALLMIAFVLVLAYVLLGVRSSSKKHTAPAPPAEVEIETNVISEEAMATPAELDEPPPMPVVQKKTPLRPVPKPDAQPGPSTLYQPGRPRRNSETAVKVDFDQAGPPDAVASNPPVLTDSFARYSTQLDILDGTNSPLPALRAGNRLPATLCDRMLAVEKLVKKDWCRPNKSTVFTKQYNQMLNNDWIAPFGNVPRETHDIVKEVAKQSESEAVARLSKLYETLQQMVVPGKNANHPEERHTLPWSLKQLTGDTSSPIVTLLVVWFVLPYRGYTCQGCSTSRLEIGHAHPATRCNAGPGQVIIVRKIFEEMCTATELALIDWLEYIAVRFMLARLFSGRMAEFWDDSIRIGISPDEKARAYTSGGHVGDGTLREDSVQGGFVANVVVFAPMSDKKDGIGNQGWFELYLQGKQNFLQGVYRVAQQWTHTRCPGRRLDFMKDRIIEIPAVPGVSAKKWQHTSVQPIFSTRLIVRPGFPIASANDGEWEAEAAAAKQIKFLPREAHEVQVSESRIRAHGPVRPKTSSVLSFRQLVQYLKPEVLIFQNERQNAWHPRLKTGGLPLQFTRPEMEFMLGLCTVPLQRKPASTGEGDEEAGIYDIELATGFLQTIRAVDLGGIVPYVSRGELSEAAGQAGKQVLNLLFPLPDARTRQGQSRYRRSEDVKKEAPLAVPRARTVVLPFIEPADQPNGGAFILFDPKAGLYHEILDGSLSKDKNNTTIIFTLANTDDATLSRIRDDIVRYFISLVDIRDGPGWELGSKPDQRLPALIEAAGKAVRFASIKDAQPTSWPYQTRRLAEVGFVEAANAALQQWQSENVFVDAPA